LSGGQNFDRLPRGEGTKYEKKQILCAKTQKITIFQNQGGGASFEGPPCPPPIYVPAYKGVLMIIE